MASFWLDAERIMRLVFFVLGLFKVLTPATTDLMFKQLETIMQRKLYEKNNMFKSQRIIDLRQATLYDPVDYFTRFLID